MYRAGTGCHFTHVCTTTVLYAVSFKLSCPSGVGEQRTQQLCKRWLPVAARLPTQEGISGRYDHVRTNGL